MSAKRREEKDRGALALAIGAAFLLLLALAGLLLLRGGGEEQALLPTISAPLIPSPTAPIPTPTVVEVVAEPSTSLPREWSKGDPAAKVVIIEYSDYQCPFCARYAVKTFPRIDAKYIQTGKVRYVFKDFPLSMIHPQAQKAAEAAKCAGEQGGFWEMHETLFRKQREWSGKAEAKVLALFKDYASELGLNPEVFESCLDKGKYAEAVKAEFMEGLARGVRGTPTFFVNGRPLVGAYPFEEFARIIEEELKK